MNATTKKARGLKNTAVRIANAEKVLPELISKFSTMHDSGEWYWGVITGSDAAELTCYLVSVWGLTEGVVAHCMSCTNDGKVYWDVTVEGRKILDKLADDTSNPFVTRLQLNERTTGDLETIMTKFSDVNRGYTGERCFAHVTRRDNAYRKADNAGQKARQWDFMVESPVTGRKVPLDVKTNVRSATTHEIIIITI